jgi:PilZ domain
MKPDSRKDRRFAVQLPSVFREGEQMDQATVLNLSLQGCALTAERLPKAQSYLSLQVDMLNGTEPVLIELAAVRWVSGYQCGVEFIRMAPEMTTRLRSFVALLEKTP